MTTINMDLDFPGGGPAAHATVAVRLQAGTAGGTDGVTVIGDTVKVKLSATGTGSIDLTANSAITPANTYYSFTLEGARPALVRHISVPVSGGPYDLGDVSIQVAAPAAPTVYPAPGAGTDGQYLHTDGTTATWASVGADDLSDVDTTTSAPTTGQALVWDGSEWVPGTVSGSGASYAAAPYFLLATSAVDGTATTFDIVKPSYGASASGNVPAGYASTTALGSVAAFQSALTGAGFESTLVTVAVVGTADPGFYQISSDTLTSAWPEVVAPVGLGIGAIDGQAVLNGDGDTTALAADAVAFTGSGLTAPNLSVQTAIDGIEGSLDRSRWVSAVATSDVDTSDFGNASWEYGALNFVDGSAQATTHCYVWLRGQSTSSENGIWQVDVTTYAGTQFADPDVFDPPGNGSYRTLNAPGDEHDNMRWEWLDDDPTRWQRVSSGTPASTEGRWVRHTHSTDSSGMQSVVKTTAQSVTSSTTLVDITSLGFDVTNGTPVDFDGVLFVDGNSSGDMRFAITGPTGTLEASTLNISYAGGSTDTGYRQYNELQSFGAEVTDFGTITGGTVTIRITGSVVPTADGTVQFQFAQRSSNATATTIRIGSKLRWINATGGA